MIQEGERRRAAMLRVEGRTYIENPFASAKEPPYLFRMVSDDPEIHITGEAQIKSGKPPDDTYRHSFQFIPASEEQFKKCVSEMKNLKTLQQGKPRKHKQLHQRTFKAEPLSEMSQYIAHLNQGNHF